MRKLMWFTVGFAAACVVGAYWVSGLWLLLLALFCFACLIAAALLLQGREKQTLFLLLGTIVAFLWMWGYDNWYLSVAEQYDGQTVDAVVEISDYSAPAEYGISAEGYVELEGKRYRIRMYSYATEDLLPGDRIEGKLKLKYTRAPGWSDYYSSSGVYLIGYMDEDVSVTSADSVPLRYFPAQLRRQITDILDSSFPADTLAFARALLLGDSSLLSYETDTELSISGIRHIIAVSGLHVSILFSVVYSLVGYRKLLTPLVGLPLLLLFAAVAGFTPSVSRACIMQALMIFALMFDKEYDPPTALSFAVLTMLAVNPMTIASVGFQLSVGCLVGIFLFSEKIQTYLLQEKRLGTAKGNSMKARLVRWIASGVSVTVSTMVMTMPLCAYYFGTISLISILTNLLTLWVVSILFCGIMAVCILGAVFLPAAKLVAWVISWPMRYVLLTAKLLSSFPLAAVYTQSGYIVAWLVFCYILLTVFMLQKKKQPAMLLCTALLSLCVAVGASWIEPKLDNYRVTMLDVGQGQCILLQNGDQHYVIDCGGDYPEGTADLAAQTLLSQGITQIDGLILTHYDQDHTGGVEYFLTRISAENLYLPNVEDKGTVKSWLAENYTQKIHWIEPMESLAVDGGDVMLFAGDGTKEDNESGLCILCSFENCDILITGDRSTAGENALLQQTVLPDLEVLVAGHHGSAYSTGRPLLLATRPEVVLISAAKDNPYGHPAEALLERLAAFGCQVLCTGDNGTIMIRG